MEWRSEGILLSARRHGETAMIIQVFTPDHGLHAGVVRGGASRKSAPILQPGAQLDVTWKARLEEHLGSFAVEPIKSRAAAVMGDRIALAGLNSVCALLSYALPERDAHPEFYTQTLMVFDLLGESEHWPIAYLHWELALLEEMGFGLELESCAVTGVTQDLKFVSPRSGRAVSTKGAGEWADRLLPLPDCLKMPAADAAGLMEGLRVTGHFLKTRLAQGLEAALPEARARLIDNLESRRKDAPK